MHDFAVGIFHAAIRRGVFFQQERRARGFVAVLVEMLHHQAAVRRFAQFFAVVAVFNGFICRLAFGV
ncbi:hypothetical protein [Cardiobacterium hominis]